MYQLKSKSVGIAKKDCSDQNKSEGKERNYEPFR